MESVEMATQEGEDLGGRAFHLKSVCRMYIRCLAFAKLYPLTAEVSEQCFVDDSQVLEVELRRRLAIKQLFKLQDSAFTLAVHVVEHSRHVKANAVAILVTMDVNLQQDIVQPRSSH